MITKAMLNSETDDVALVAECLVGNRDAFGLIVRRYQSLICSLAYNATGNLLQSEDLAQETFFAAWRHLRDLREPAKLRPWLCQIARNITFDALKKQGREPMHRAETLEAATESHASEASPTENAISREEEALLWRSIADIPESYREPLILFYRQHQSVTSVAKSLDLTEDAVKQRLSRGRRLLREQVLAFVEGTLERTNPGAAFTQGVMLALPMITTPAATAAAIKAGATGKAAAAALGGVFLIIFGNYAGYRTALEMAGSDREKTLIKRFYRNLIIAVIVCNVALALLIYWGTASGKVRPATFVGTIATFAFITIAAFTFMGFRHWKHARHLAISAPSKTAWEYRSRIEIFGLPLVNIRVGGPQQAVKGWIAAGGCAVGGLFAFGGVAIAPLSIGGLSLGLLSWGGMALGLLAMGGVTVGGWVFGGMAVGWKAYGACAVAWKAAMGAAALAHDFAAGGIAHAAQAGTPAADAYVKSSDFFRTAEWLSRYAGWLNLLWVLPMILWWRMAARRNRQHIAAAILFFAMVFPLCRPVQAQPSTNIEPERFDNLVRDDFFSGDPTRLEHAIKLCDERLAANPKFAPAISWKGAGDLFEAGMAFRTNNIGKGIELWKRGMGEMDQAVALKPEGIDVLIPRGATYLSIAKYDPDVHESRHLVETGVADYEKVLGIQKPYFDTLSRHSRGELLFGLADGWFRLDDLEKSRAYLRRIVSDCPNSAYSKRAADWLETKDTAALKQKSRELTCTGCHGE
jgi:RNA polymerase sigma factor (sigma-70 family)